MKLSDGGLSFIASWEGYRALAYRDVGGVWTIGYGHTGDVHAGDRASHQKALELLRADVHEAEASVNEHVHVGVNQDRFDALVSLTFNIGASAFAHSNLLRKLNAGDYPGVAGEFARWNHVDGRVVEGLTRRRKAEADLWRGD